MRKKRFVFLSAVLAVFVAMNAQNRVQFAYDQAGNRVKRELVITHNAHSAKKAASREEAYFEDLGERTVKISSNGSGIIKITVLHMHTEDEGNVEVYSLGGSEVLNRSLSSAETLVDISDKPKGVYILKVTLNGKVTTWKITKK
ncbi:T9SS type A sorting domain-containing protein [Prevotella communis]|uniref:T9SS type A sorting domain-containing protein n=1 Tax=Prevotella communis TaxID=2913614 RepID=UPI001EDC1709|nr:T9SS type A sorting domain-containing protein [Prevotella communis]UKK59365.1 T9SS type A sorting domain-containing protein [Prevotella communis]UKK62131.1 T9SS type A sorting domain-containing protein [Prevotella communis]UKK64958.1 T9SS type A sorting domain-containing protein [Prevotella communis]UKK67331.1 T9SS type A sorting domain-containing protein [Prevotella communis]